MPAELHILKEQLHRLNLLYTDAEVSDASKEAKQKLKDQIMDLQGRITERTKFVKQQESSN